MSATLVPMNAKTAIAGTQPIANHAASLESNACQPWVTEIIAEILTSPLRLAEL
jgi:hypothetical protein